MLFDIILIALFLIGVCVYEFSRSKSYSVVYVLGILAAAWFFFSPVKTWAISEGWIGVARWVGFYLLIGVGVATVKWVLHNLKVAEKIRDLKEEFNKSSASKLEPAARREAFISWWNSCRATSVAKVETSGVDFTNEDIITELLVPRARKHIDDISIWVIEWPFVVVGMVISDFLTKFGKHVAKLFDRLFTGLGKMLIRNALKGI